MTFFKYIKSKGTLCQRVISGKSGFILIGLVLTMIVFAALVAAIVPMFSSATQNQVSANMDQKAYYMAESGFRYAASRYLHDYTGDGRDQTLLDLHNKTFTLADGNSGFGIYNESFFYKIASSGNALPFGAVPKIDINTTTANGIIAVYTSGASTYSFINYASYTVDTNRSSIAFSPTTLTPTGSIVFPAATIASNYTDMPPNLTLTLGGSPDLSLFPLSNGTFRIAKSDGSLKYPDLYTYKSLNRVTKIFTDVNRIMGTTASVPLAATDILLLQRVIRFTSTGTVGNTNASLFASRPLIYQVPVEALSAVLSGGTTNNTVAPDSLTTNNPLDTAGNKWGTFSTAFGSTAVNVTDAGSGSQNENVLTFGSSQSSSQLGPLITAWNYSGGFLSYDAQVKIATGTTTDGGITFTAKSPYYLAGLVLRFLKDLTGQDKGTFLGVSFLRDNSYAGIISANIDPAGALNVPRVVLWVRTDIGRYQWLAYKNLNTSGNATGDPVLDAPSTLNNRGAWNNNINYKIYDKVIRSSVTYICIEDHKSSNSNRPPNNSYWVNTAVAPRIYLSDWATIVARIVEAASVELGTTEPSAEPGDQVQAGDGSVTAKVIKKIKNNNNWVLLLNNVLPNSGSFTEKTIGGIPVTSYRARDNYIWAFYGDKANHPSSGTYDNDPTNLVRRQNLPGTVKWPKSKMKEWSDIEDYFTLVQWSSTTNASPTNYGLSILSDIGPSGVITNAIIRMSSNLMLTTGYGSAPPPNITAFPLNVYELGLEAYGDTPEQVYFTDFSYSTVTSSGGGSGSVGFLGGPVQQ